jgi:ABC transporter substrate binding protein
LPAMCPYRDYVEAGGRMAYAVDLAELLRRMADEVHQILKGAKPDDIPIYQVTKFELLITPLGRANEGRIQPRNDPAHLQADPGRLDDRLLVAEQMPLLALRTSALCQAPARLCESGGSGRLHRARL